MSLLESTTIRKSELADIYGVHRKYLSVLLNQVYYDELVKVGYNKTCKTISPMIVRKFIELYGEPLTVEDYQVKLNLR